MKQGFIIILIGLFFPTVGQNSPQDKNWKVVFEDNLNGIQLKSYTLTQRGVQAVTVYASELPADMYLYTLVVDNVIIDSKRMILTK
jgi:hypothetical protein